MKIFFIASIHGKDKFEKNYKQILSYFQDEGHIVEADHVLGVTKDEIDNWDDSRDVKFHKQILAGIRSADLIVTDLSYTSTSVGYLVSVAIESGKPTIAFYAGEETPHLLTTLKQNEKFQVVNYNNPSELQNEIPVLIDYATGQMDTRFNFFISRKLSSYLDWIANKRRIPRAVYLRQLISREMRKYPEFRKR